MSTLSISNVSLNFGGIKALTEVSLEIEKRSFVGLMGPNGAGKTTLLNCVSRIYEPETGSMVFDGIDLLKLRGDQLTQVGISRTFQDLNFFSRIERMSVIDYMCIGQFNPRQVKLIGDGFQLKKSQDDEKELRKKARRILDFFKQLRQHLEPPEEERGYPILLGREGFPDLLDYEFGPIANLSFAWRRRLDLARALVSQPSLLLLDEPAQGLAPSEIENLGHSLKFIQAEYGVSALIVEHNVDTLMKISDRVVVMNHGQVICSGKPADVRQNKEVISIYLGSKEVSDKPSKATKKNDYIASQKPLLEVKNIDQFYGSAQSLFSMSLKIYPNQIVSILGTNGSGKSTLLKSISGIEKPSFGEIIFKGEILPLGWAEVASQRGIQYVPQGHVIFPELSILDNLKIGAYVWEKRGNKIKDGLEKVYDYFPELKKRQHIQAANLSGGQQQMLAMAQALISKPELILLDEPTLGLSPILVDELFNIILRISREENCAIVLVEQSVNKALEISDYIFMLSSGVLIGQGTSEQMKANDETIKKYLGFR